MHKLFISDITENSLKRMKKRIQSYRDAKLNSGSDSFKSLDLDFFENCIDAMIELKQRGTDCSYEDVVKEVNNSTQSKDYSHSLISPLLDNETLVKGNDYVLWEDKALFNERFAYFLTVTGGLANMSALYIILKSGSVFKCKSHSYLTDDMDNEAVTATYMGDVAVKIPDIISKPTVSIHHLAVMDAIDYNLYCVVDDMLCDCIGCGSTDVTPKEDYQYYKDLLESCMSLQ